jgi:hypothetical protein
VAYDIFNDFTASERATLFAAKELFYQITGIEWVSASEVEAHNSVLIKKQVSHMYICSHTCQGLDDLKNRKKKIFCLFVVWAHL